MLQVTKNHQVTPKNVSGSHPFYGNLVCKASVPEERAELEVFFRDFFDKLGDDQSEMFYSQNDDKTIFWVNAISLERVKERIEFIAKCLESSFQYEDLQLKISEG